MKSDLSRRELFTAGAVAGLSAAFPAAAFPAENPRPAGEPFGYCLNTSTIRGQNLSLAEEVEIAAKAGYQGIEPWIREIDQHIKSGGTLKDLAARIRDSGLTVASAIGFAEWIVDDDARRQKGMDEARRSMDLVQQIGGKRIAAPPAGAVDRADLNLFQITDRYRALLELGEKTGVVPELEVWGFSKTLGRLGETALVAIESGHRDACLLPDVYHLYKGGSAANGLKLLSGGALHVIHFNDYPAAPPRNEITDAHRVYPGDGVAPLSSILLDLRSIGFRGMLSLEVFNREYWKQNALTVARTGLEKMRAVVRDTFSPPC